MERSHNISANGNDTVQMPDHSVYNVYRVRQRSVCDC